jgi:hypothetical protein
MMGQAMRDYLENCEPGRNAGPRRAGLIVALVTIWYGAIGFVALHFIVKYW